MSVFMLALLGFPVFGGLGFIAKYYLVQASLDSAYPRGTLLAVILVLTSVVSAGYYLYVVMVMFMRPRPGIVGAPRRMAYGSGMPTRVVVVATAVLLFVFGLLPENVLQWANRSGLTQPRYGVPSGVPAVTGRE
jgi:NADH-quinone oxidoreductase subunit N